MVVFLIDAFFDLSFPKSGLLDESTLNPTPTV
jgi:hypothetical protein